MNRARDFTLVASLSLFLLNDPVQAQQLPPAGDVPAVETEDGDPSESPAASDGSPGSPPETDDDEEPSEPSEADQLGDDEAISEDDSSEPGPEPAALVALSKKALSATFPEALTMEH